MVAQKGRIVTADDDPQLLRLIARNLEFEGYDVETASDGASFILKPTGQSQPENALLARSAARFPAVIAL